MKWGRLNNRLFGYSFPINMEKDDPRQPARLVPWLSAVLVHVHMAQCTDCACAKDPHVIKNSFMALPNGSELYGEAKYQYIKSKFGAPFYWLGGGLETDSESSREEVRFGFTSEGQDRDVEFYLTQTAKILRILGHNVSECVAAINVTVTEPHILQFLQDVETYQGVRGVQLNDMDRWALKNKLRLSTVVSHIARDASTWVNTHI